MRLLLVDDSWDLVRALEKKFRSRGWEVSIASDVREALQLIDPTFAAVLLDRKLPDGIGEMVAVEMRARADLDHVAIVMFTAFPSVESAVISMKVGVDDYAEKHSSEAAIESLHQKLLAAVTARSRRRSASPSTSTTSSDQIAQASTLIQSFERLRPGRDDAAAYHDLILKSLVLVFATQLHKPIKEERLDDGRKRVDIVFNNSADHGFFNDLQRRHAVRSPYVFFECKNYSIELGNPDFDQLVGRFSEKSSLFGAIVCRNNHDPVLALKRCRDVVAKNRGYVIVLDDNDLKTLLTYRMKDNEQAIDNHMDDLFRRLVL